MAALHFLGWFKYLVLFYKVMQMRMILKTLLKDWGNVLLILAGLVALINSVSKLTL